MAFGGIVRLFELVARPFRGGTAIDREIEEHLELQIEALLERGMPREAARRAALARFGDLSTYRRALMAINGRAERGRRWRMGWDNLVQDLGYVIRGLKRSPAFAVGVVATLALGIGVNATMVGLVDRLLFKAPAHVADPGTVVRYTLTQTHPTFGSFTNTSVTYKELDLQRATPSLQGLAAYFPSPLSYGRGEAARPLRASLVSPDFFSLLGIRPAAGRFFEAADDPVGGGTPIVVISDRLWRREFGGRHEALGQSLWLGSRQYQIVGIAPPGFAGVDLNAVDAWLPLNTGAREFMGPSDGWRDTWDWQWVKLIGRLAPGTTREQASAQATTLYRAATADHPERKDDRGTVTFQPLVAGRGADQTATPMIAALLAGVSVLVLLISCANVANLLLARGVARRRETAVRVALGVGRGRLVRALILEGTCLSVAAAILGIGLAYGGGALVRSVLLPGIDFVDPPVDGRLLGVAFGAALATGLLVALVPALRLTRAQPALDLRAASSPQGSAGRDHARIRGGLLAFQAVLSVIMLLCAGVYYKSLKTATSVDFGFRPEGLLTADIDLDVAGYGAPQRWAFYDQALERIRSIPGVASASLTTTNPFWTRQGTSVRLPGRDSVPRLKSGGPYFSAVTPDHFATLGIRVIKGRGFAAGDHAGGARVLVINETMAKTYWPGEEPIGKCVFVGRNASVCREVVGVTVDASNEELEAVPVLGYYLPLAQVDSLASDRYLMIRATGSSLEMVSVIRKTLQTMATNLPVANVRLMQEQIEPLTRPWRLGATLFGSMAAIALLVALVGLYSVLAFQVAERRREFGIRTALGARETDVARMVVLQGQRVVLVGTAIGIALVAGAVKLLVPAEVLRRLLFQTSPFDPVVMAAAVALMVLTTLVGSMIPARRASRIPPMEAIRSD